MYLVAEVIDGSKLRVQYGTDGQITVNFAQGGLQLEGMEPRTKVIVKAVVLWALLNTTNKQYNKGAVLNARKKLKRDLLMEAFSVNTVSNFDGKEPVGEYELRDGVLYHGEEEVTPGAALDSVAYWAYFFAAKAA